MMFKKAFWLAKKDIQQSWISVSVTIVVTAFLGLITAIFLEQLVSNLFGSKTNDSMALAIDIMFLGMTPSLAALFMSGPYLSFRAIKEDPFSKRLAFFRSLPIPVNILALSRTIFMLTTLIILSSIFYIVLAISLPQQFYLYITLNELVLFILCWFGYALALGGMNSFIEYGTNGKILHTVPYIFMGVLFLVIIIVRQVTGHGIVEWSFLLVKDYGWIAAFSMMAIGIFGCTIWNHVLFKRLLKRDYL